MPRTLRPRRVRPSGDDRPARGLWGYVLRMSGPHQLGLCGGAVLVAVLDVVPVELQRRLIDDAIAPGDAGLLWQLAGLYLATVVLHQALKFGLRLYQGWVSESAVVHTRRHSLRTRLRRAERGELKAEEDPGASAMVVGTEIDKLGSFVGSGVSDACSHFALLAGVFGYMIWTEPQLALVSALLLAPQGVIAPLLQGRLNRLTRTRVRLLRSLGARAGERRGALTGVVRLLPRVYGNRLAIQTVKAGMKGLLNLLNQLGPLAALAYGGWMVTQGETTVGTVVAFVSAFQRLAGPLRGLLTFYRQWEQARVQHGLVARWMTGRS
jgi:ABC-type multidrug transport system fused ATPase/permease subunit